MKILASAVRQASSLDRKPITVATIIQEAGVSQATFYYHYDSIEHLLSELVDQAVSRVETRIDKDSAVDAPEAINGAVSEVIFEMAKYPSLFEGDVPPSWVTKFSEPIISVMTAAYGDVSSTAKIAELSAAYHVNAWIGMIRSSKEFDAKAITEFATLQLAVVYEALSRSQYSITKLRPLKPATESE